MKRILILAGNDEIMDSIVERKIAYAGKLCLGPGGWSCEAVRDSAGLAGIKWS